MERILIFIKHHLVFLWKIFEWGNSIAFTILYGSRLEKVNPLVFREFNNLPFLYRRLCLSDAELLHRLIISQEVSDLDYFSPHSFCKDSIIKQFNNRSFLMMGVFDGDKMAGYYFLRFFANRKCFVGRLIDKDYRGRGIGNVMNSIMYETAWRMCFRCLSTISRNNKAVMRSHSGNKAMVILKELQNDYLLVEFIREAET